MVIYRVMGESFVGSWSRLSNGRYVMSPGSPEDFVQMRKGKLEQWDATGFIRAFNRVGPVRSSTPAASQAATQAERRRAQEWAYANFTPGMYWNADAKALFVANLGRYVTSKARPPYHRALYFATPDLTLLIDDDRGVAMVLREGKVTH
jgi:hypothetical protein